MLSASYSILGFGVSLAIKGEYAHKKTEFGVGLGLAISGLLAVIAAALGFGAAVSMINKRWVSSGKSYYRIRSTHDRSED